MGRRVPLGAPAIVRSEGGHASKDGFVAEEPGPERSSRRSNHLPRSPTWSSRTNASRYAISSSRVVRRGSPFTNSSGGPAGSTLANRSNSVPRFERESRCVDDGTAGAVEKPGGSVSSGPGEALATPPSIPTVHQPLASDNQSANDSYDSGRRGYDLDAPSGGDYARATMDDRTHPIARIISGVPAGPSRGRSPSNDAGGDRPRSRSSIGPPGSGGSRAP